MFKEICEILKISQSAVHFTEEEENEIISEELRKLQNNLPQDILEYVQKY